MATERDDEDEGLSVIELEENLSDVEKPPILPKGRYRGEVQDVKVQTSAKGNKYYNIAFRIAPSEMPADIADHYEDGVDLYWNRQLVPRKGDRRTLYNLRKFLEALDLDSNVTAIDPSEWMGQEATLVVRVGRYNGEDRPEIASIEKAEGAAPAPRRSPRKAASAPAEEEEEVVENEEVEEEPAPRRTARRR